MSRHQTINSIPVKTIISFNGARPEEPTMKSPKQHLKYFGLWQLKRKNPL